MAKRRSCLVVAGGAAVAIGVLALIMVLTPIMWFGGIMLHLALTTHYACFPPEYPSLAGGQIKAGVALTSFTADSIEQVRDRYWALLKPKTGASPDEKWVWEMTQLAQGYLLECWNTPNDLEVECAGILLTPAKGGTTIERVRVVSEGSGCRGFLHMPQE